VKALKPVRPTIPLGIVIFLVFFTLQCFHYFDLLLTASLSVGLYIIKGGAANLNVRGGVNALEGGGCNTINTLKLEKVSGA